MSGTALISFREQDGTLLGSLWNIFSGSTIARGTTSSTAKFRTYNNYSGSSDIPDMRGFHLKISTEDPVYDIVDNPDSYNDFTYELISGGHMEIRCTIAGETGLAPPSGNTFTPFSGTFSGSGFDYIASSGTFNYNEYEVRFNIPSSGSEWFTSGTCEPSIFAYWQDTNF